MSGRLLSVSAVRCILMALVVALLPLPALAQQAAPPRTIADLIPLFEQYQPDPARLAALRAVAREEPPQNASQGDLAKFFLKRGNATFDLGENRKAMQDLSQVIESGGRAERIQALTRLGWIEVIEGETAKGLDRIKQALDQIPEWHGARIEVLGLYLSLAAKLGQLDRVGPTIKSINDVVNWNRYQPAWVLYEHHNLERQNRYVGAALKETGKLTEAEAAFREALRRGGLDGPDIQKRRNMGLPDYTPAERALFQSQTKAMLAEVLAKQGRSLEAELLMRESLSDSLSGNGPPERTALILAIALETLMSLDRLAEAEAMARAGLSMLARTGAKPEGVLLLFLRRSLANSLAEQGRYEEAVREALALNAALPATHPWLVETAKVGTPETGLALGRSGRVKEGLAMLDAQYARSTEWRGKDHSQTALIQGYRGIVRAAAGDRPGALSDLRAAVEVQLARQNDAYENVARSDVRRFGVILDAYLAALGEAAAAPPPGLDPAAEAFRLADVLRSRKIQSALSASAARASADTPELAALVRKLQDLGGEEEALTKILFNMSMLPPEKQLPKVMADMRQRLEAIKPERGTLAADVRTRFPAYADLVRPKPATIADIQAALQPGEAFISVLPTEKSTLVWAIPKSGKPAFALAPLGSKELDHIVGRLRKGLDTGNATLDQLPAFDLQAAHGLYKSLLAPVTAGWEGASHLFVSTSGSLSQLPFAVLPTTPANPAAGKLRFAEYRKVPWLVRKAAITQLPSGSALITLRKMKSGSPDRAEFVGFGDPNFGAGESQKTAAAIRRNLAITRATGMDIAEQGKVDWIAYSQLPPLPDTREELLAVAQALGADPRVDVLLGSKASKQTVKGMDLSRRRIVAFATHGLLPGDFPGLDQPALAMASNGSAEEGLLKLEEILKLKLDADWVVLSACNTAAGDGEGAEAISGLGRGFFYAGARALLATHWPVETVSAKDLVKGIFTRYADGAGVSRAESLRRAMLALIDEGVATTYAYAHPMFWAPYVIIGDGGSR
ncbi:MAG: CHAT domain-containing protein [Anaerolineae bacterium]|nr:hypothetical protein [Rhodocyclaceae bacterium]MCZ2112623.1 CHAT domain-containing protein [Anaerolineae bacterium]